MTHRRNDIQQINRDDQAKLEQKARDLGFSVKGRQISEEQGKKARLTLFLEAKGYGADLPERDF